MQVEHSRNKQVQRSPGGTCLGTCRPFSMTCIPGVITDEDTDRNRGQVRGLLNVTHYSFNNLKAKKIHQNVARREQSKVFLFCFVLFCFYLMVSYRRRQWHLTPVLLPRKSHGRRSVVGCSPWGCEELDMTERLHFHFPLSCIGEGNGNPLQCSCLENSRDGEAWWAAIYGVAQSRTRLKRLSMVSYFSLNFLFMVLHIHESILLKLFSHVGYYKISSRLLCTIHQVFVGYLF